MEDLRQDLRAVTKKCRPRLGHYRAGDEEGMERGTQRTLLPYGKTYAQSLGEQD
jgi:hypothetical protein